MIIMGMLFICICKEKKEISKATFFSIEEARKHPSLVTHLQLDNKGYKKFPDITDFHNLESLSLSNNEISNIPNELLNCKKLKKIFIERNKLTSLPPELSELKELTHVIAIFNKIDTIPESMCSLQKLELLNLSGNPNTFMPECLKRRNSIVKYRH